MQLYRSCLELGSASASRWQGDTLFGHLCWYLVRSEGETFLTDFLTRYRKGKPPILISDGSPAGFLPRPRAAATEHPSQAQRSKRHRIEAYRKTKEAAKARWLTVEEFNQARAGQLVSPQTQPEVGERVVSKNRIDRRTGTTGGESGELFAFTEHCIAAIDIYWLLAEGYLDMVLAFLADLQQTGYGKRKSVGYGHIATLNLEPFSAFSTIEGANGFVSLARFVPAASDPTTGFWSTAVKYGKLGEEGAFSEQPFKRPLIQLDAGSCFFDQPVGHVYGRVVEDVVPDPRVVQYAFAFPVPMRLPDPGLQGAL